MSFPFDPRAEIAFYKHHLQTTLLPFWLTRSVDRECGGFFTCFDNEGRRLLSHDKFTWSQGRMVWVWAKLAEMALFEPSARADYLALARSGATFLMEHCLLPSGNCAFLMSREGTPKPQAPGMPLDSSIYADCFVILGLARYAAASREHTALDFARQLYRAVIRRIETGAFHTEPYPIPTGYRTHGIPMILLNTSQELAAALDALGLAGEAAEVNRAADGYLRQIMTDFVTADGVLHEMVRGADEGEADTLLGRYVNPGHTLEDLWFIMHQARRAHVPGTCEVPGTCATVLKAVQVILRAFHHGWDAEHGGLLLFADQEGGPPRGSVAGYEDDRMVQKIMGDWGSKLWWVHSEALYATLLAFVLTGDTECLARYQQVREYAFRTFPHPDPAIGEWIQIRDRQGRPEPKVVALPVKDPFHIIRNVVQIIELLEQTQ